MNDCPLECGSKIKNFYNHYSKCKRKDYLDKDYLKCKYNYNHIIKKENYLNHLDICCNKTNSSKNHKSDSEDSDSGDLIKIFNKISKRKKQLEHEEKYENDDLSINNKTENNFKILTCNNSAFFENENDIDEDSKNFYKFAYC